MSYHKVTYEQIFPSSAYLNERIGIEILVEKGQDPESALMECKKIVSDFHKKSRPELYKFNNDSLTANEVALIKNIEMCDTAIKLSMYKGELNKNTKPYYVDRLKNLTIPKPAKAHLP